MDPVLRTAALAGCCGIRNTGAPCRAPQAFGTGAGTGGGDAASDLPDGATDAGVIDSAGVGTPAGTTRGFGPAEFREIGNMVADVLDGLAKKGEHGDPQVEADVRTRVRTLCARFPIYQG